MLALHVEAGLLCVEARLSVMDGFLMTAVRETCEVHLPVPEHELLVQRSFRGVLVLRPEQIYLFIINTL